LLALGFAGIEKFDSVAISLPVADQTAQSQGVAGIRQGELQVDDIIWFQLDGSNQE